MPTYEIERKYLVKDIPNNLSSYPFHKIEQGYLCTEPVVRIRKQDNDYFLTYKGNGLMVREEYNLPLTESAYQTLKPKVDGYVISKTRYCIPLAETDLMIELDIFDAPFAPLALAEVEFPSKESADAFSPPHWFSEDVTFDKKYHNSNMSKSFEYK